VQDVKTLSERMMKFIENQQANMNRLCSNLIQARSENPPGDVSEAAQVAEDFLTHRGITCQKLEPEKGHITIIGTVGKGRPSLILCGHIDVVPAGDVSQWHVAPYNGAIENGKLHGRGATDQKGGVAAMLMASAAAKEYENEIAGKVTVACVPDEEAQGPAGVSWLLENKKLTGDMCLITEPTGYLDEKYTIVAGERGAYWLRITAHGKPAHGSTPALGRNAIEMTNEFLPKLKALEMGAVKTPRDAEQLIKNGMKQLARVAKKQGIPANSLTKTLTHYTLNTGTIRGGTKINIVPEKCEAEVDIRIPAGGRPEGVEEFVRSLLPEKMEYEVINKTMPSYTAPDNQLIRTLQRGVSQVLGYDPIVRYMPATSDAHFFREVLSIPTGSFGPGYEELLHAYDEFVYMKDVENAAKVYAKTIAEIVS